MSLEGPQISPTDRFRASLYAATPRALWRARSQFLGLGATVPPPPPISEPSILDTFKAHPVVLLLGVFGGMWLAGSKTGQGFWKKK